MIPCLQFSGAALVLLPLESLLAWACVAHPRELEWLADRDQTYVLSAILAWVGAHCSLAAGLAGLWLLLQAAAGADGQGSGGHKGGRGQDAGGSRGSQGSGGGSRGQAEGPGLASSIRGGRI